VLGFWIGINGRELFDKFLGIATAFGDCAEFHATIFLGDFLDRVWQFTLHCEENDGQGMLVGWLVDL
jgi:hypothetical protein